MVTNKALTLTIRRSGIALILYAGLIVLAWMGFNAVPGGFIPSQDKQYLIAVAQLPPASTIDRTEAVVRRMSAIGLKTPGVRARGGIRGHVGERLVAEFQFRHCLLRAGSARQTQGR